MSLASSIAATTCSNLCELKISKSSQELYLYIHQPSLWFPSAAIHIGVLGLLILSSPL